MPSRRRRVLSIGHSYCVALNRRLPAEIARVAGWDVTVVAPTFFQGDLRPVWLEPASNGDCELQGIRAYFTRSIHLMLYERRLGELLHGPWDLVHCWEEPYILAGGQVAWLTPSRVPLVYATFQNIAKRYPPPLNWIERYTMSRASGWIAFGHGVYQVLEGKAQLAGRPKRVIPVGVDVDHFRPDRTAGLSVRRQLGWETPTPPVIGFLGRFVPEKGLHMLMSVLDKLTVPWRALIVGGGPLERALREWAARHGERVRIVSGVTHDQVPRYLNAMDLLLAPSQTLPRWQEQFGRMLIEAFACGVPVVGSDSGEIPHVLSDVGIIVPEKDEALWGRALEQLVSDPDQRAELSKRGLERARSEYAWPEVARQHVEFFSQLLDRDI